MEGVRSLEVRWILPGQLDMAVAGWFDRSRPEIESREDAYLLDPDVGGLSVKVRAGRALEVKAFHGSGGILDIPGRARGRLQYWQKWSFPFRPLSQNNSPPDGWRRVRKQRRTSRFSLTGRRITACVRELADEAWCAVELTELRAHHQDWWSLGSKRPAPGDLLRTGLEATATLVFTQALPDGVELRVDNSASYAEWLRARPHPQSSTAGDDGCGPGSEPENSLPGKMPTMPLHERDTVSEQLADCVFAGRDMTRPVPKYRFPRNETLPRGAFQVGWITLILAVLQFIAGHGVLAGNQLARCWLSVDRDEHFSQRLEGCGPPGPEAPDPR